MKPMLVDKKNYEIVHNSGLFAGPIRNSTFTYAVCEPYRFTGMVLGVWPTMFEDYSDNLAEDYKRCFLARAAGYDMSVINAGLELCERYANQTSSGIAIIPRRFIRNQSEKPYRSDINLADDEKFRLHAELATDNSDNALGGYLIPNCNMEREKIALARVPTVSTLTQEKINYIKQVGYKKL